MVCDTFLRLSFRQLGSRLAKQNINLLECPVLRLQHEKELVEPTQHGNAAVETKCEARLRLSALHVTKEVGYEQWAARIALHPHFVIGTVLYAAMPMGRGQVGFTMSPSPSCARRSDRLLMPVPPVRQA